MALIEARRDRYGALAEPALASHARPDDCARVAGWIGPFPRRARRSIRRARSIILVQGGARQMRWARGNEIAPACHGPRPVG